MLTLLAGLLLIAVVLVLVLKDTYGWLAEDEDLPPMPQIKPIFYSIPNNGWSSGTTTTTFPMMAQPITMTTGSTLTTATLQHMLTQVYSATQIQHLQSQSNWYLSGFGGQRGQAQTPPASPAPQTPPPFNAFLNASDLVERFIAFAKAQDVRQEQLMKLPMGLFLNWLVIEAADADGEPRPEGVVVQFPKRLTAGRRQRRKKEKAA